MRVNQRRLNVGLDRYSGLYLWLAFIVIFGIWAPGTFLTAATVHAIASQQAVAGMLAIGLLISMACGQFDLSIGANANLTGIFAVELQVEDHWPIFYAVLAAVAAGLLIGLVNGFVVVGLRVNSLIATLGMGSILAAVQTIITNSLQPPPATGSIWNKMTQANVGGFQLVVVYLIVLAIIAWWFLEHTPVGRYFHATGSNPDAARLSGIRVDRWSTLALVLTGGIAGLAGVLFTSQSGPSLTFGAALLLPAFAAVFLGSTQLQPGRFNVWGTFIAIFVLATGVTGLQLVSGQQWLSDMFNGVALIFAVSLAATRNRGGVGGMVRRIRWRFPGQRADAQPVSDAVGVGAMSSASRNEERGTRVHD
jgi:ribose transport system permease protein